MDAPVAVSPYPRCPAAADFALRRMQAFADVNPVAATLTATLEGVGCDIHALVDHWVLPASPDLIDDLTTWGYVEETADGLPSGERAWMHPLARLPRVRSSRTVADAGLALAVEDIGLFLEKSGLQATVRAGDADSVYETADIAVPFGTLQIVARRGYRGFTPGVMDDASRKSLAAVRALFAARVRDADETEVFQDAGVRFTHATSLIGRDRAVDEFFAEERAFYLTRNAAARFQHARQQAVGIGWANHDHHTYRSSREGFQPLMRLWEQMGFIFRERFYAGADAGWGAQVSEHPVSRVILFCDVDMSPAELDTDFLHVPLEPRATLGTIGLWCALHGSSIAEAGMHHIECEFDFARCEAGFKAAGFGVMKPFTDLPMLKQAFTTPELWTVPAKRLAAVRALNAITDAQAAAFAQGGAAGSHIEILQRWDGFKGFNKTGVSAIIRETDARNAALV